MSDSTPCESWIFQILESAKRDVDSWPTWLKRLRNGRALDLRKPPTPQAKIEKEKK